MEIYRWLRAAGFALLLPLYGSGCASHAEAAERYRWEHDETDRGIAVYTSEVAAHSFEAVKGVATLAYAATPIFMSLHDFAHYPSWYYRCREARVLSAPASIAPIPVLDNGQFGPIKPGGPWVLFFRQETPPLDDRWTILSCKYRAGDQHTLLVEFDSVDSHPFKASGSMVRMHLHGYWQLRPIDKHHTEVTFMLDVDPKTSMLSMFVNPVLRDTVRETLAGLKKRLENSKQLSAM